ncbi:hypothetical protein C8J57DRAFT_1339859 [Mycena rebaudengoi]|nr:hypothetical protein C8J57DRAFT_1339859 [Mycena rebaudengoi]
MASLPQELVNSIVDQLDDYSSLTSCTLVSTSFVAPAQQAIFKSLCIHTELSLRHPTPLAASDSLAAFPHLATYIRLLQFDLSHLESEVQALESIFLAVRNLERLIISGSGMQWKIWRAIDIPHLPLVRTVEIKLVVDTHSPEVPPSLSKIATTFPNIELLTVVFILKPHDQPPSPSLFAGTLLSFPARTQLPHLRQVHCQLLPRDRGQDLSVALADSSPRFFRPNLCWSPNNISVHSVRAFCDQIISAISLWDAHRSW